MREQIHSIKATTPWMVNPTHDPYDGLLVDMTKVAIRDYLTVATNDEARKDQKAAGAWILGRKEHNISFEAICNLFKIDASRARAMLKSRRKDIENANQ